MELPSNAQTEQAVGGPFWGFPGMKLPSYPLLQGYKYSPTHLEKRIRTLI